MYSGKVLRETRERKGYDLTTVARRLRIRPDILKAIEAGDFSAMPPRGYTRNMVNAYARLLGLNPTEIVNMYLDEAYANQVKKARADAPSSGFHMERETRRSRSRIGVGSGAVEDRVDERTGVTQYTRRLYDDGTPFSRDDYGVTRERTNKAGRSDRDFSSHHSGYDTSNYTFIDDQRGVKRGNRGIYAGQTGMQYKPSRVPSFLQSPVVLIAIAIVVIILIISIVVFVGGSKQSSSKDINTNITGMPNTAASVGTESSSSAEPAPTSVPVTYTVGQGSEVYVVTINDGKRSEEQLASNSERKVDVTGTFIIETPGDPSALTVTVDGETVQLKADAEFEGMYGYKVEFSSYLEKWRSTHSTRDAQRQAAVAEAGNTTPSSSSSASASATSADDSTDTQAQTDDGTSAYAQNDANNYGYTDNTGYGYTDNTDYGYTNTYGYTDNTNNYGYTDNTAYGNNQG